MAVISASVVEIFCEARESWKTSRKKCENKNFHRMEEEEKNFAPSLAPPFSPSLPPSLPPPISGSVSLPLLLPLSSLYLLFFVPKLE